MEEALNEGWSRSVGRQTLSYQLSSTSSVLNTVTKDFYLNDYCMLSGHSRIRSTKKAGKLVPFLVARITECQRQSYSKFSRPVDSGVIVVANDEQDDGTLVVVIPWIFDNKEVDWL